MPDKKITDLVDGGDPQGTDEFVVARGGDNFKVAWSSMSNAATASNIAVTADGNTAGALALVNTGTLSLAGGNNITLSQNGNAITISGANIGGAQTGISGLANSETTYISGTVSLSEQGALTIYSTTGQEYRFSVPNTSSLEATGIVSVSTNGSTISIGASQSVQPETQTFVGGISASDTLYTSGSVRISGSQAATVRSGTGQLVIIDVPAQSVQPETQTFIGGISASNTLYTSGSVRFTGSQAVTVRSGTGQLVVIDAPAQTAQTGISGIANSQTTYTSGTVSLSELGAVTIRSTTGNQFQISVNSQSVQPETQTFIGGIRNSETTYTSGTVRLSELGAITIRSTTGNAFQLSVAAQSVQPETQTFVGGIANSQTTYTSGTVSLSELGAITIRSTTGNQYQLSVNSQTVQTNDIPRLGVSTGGNTAGNTTVNSGTRMVFVGTNLVSLSQATAASASTITFDATNQNLSAGVSNVGNTAGNTTVNTGSRLVIVGSNGITASQGTAAGATTITLSGVTIPAAQTGISGIANSQTTYTSGTVSLSELGAITIRSTTGNQYQLSVNSQTAQTQGIINAGVSTGGNTSGDTTVASGTRLVFAGGNNITLSQGTAANATTITISAPNLGAGAMSAGVSTGGNTAGATGVTGTRLVFVGTNMVSLSQTTDANGGTVSINATQTVQTQGVPLLGVSTGGATSGDTGVNSGTRFVLVGTNLTMSQGTAANATTVTVSAPATSSLSATGPIQISTNGSTISIGATFPDHQYRWIEGPLQMGATQGIGASGATQTTVTAWVMPVTIAQDLIFNNAYLAAHNSFSSATTSISSINYSYSMGASLGFYSLTGSTLSQFTSFSNSLGYSNATAVAVGNMSLTARVGFGGSSTTKSTQGGANMTAIMSSINSVRRLPMMWTTQGATLTPGQYWAVACFSQLTGGANQASLSQVGFVSGYSAIGSALSPPDMMANTASVTSPYPYLGLATLVNSSNSLMPVSFNTSKVTTATAIANSTAFQSLWINLYSSHQT